VRCTVRRVVLIGRQHGGTLLLLDKWPSGAPGEERKQHQNHVYESHSLFLVYWSRIVRVWEHATIPSRPTPRKMNLAQFVSPIRELVSATHRQRYDLQLIQYDERGRRATLLHDPGSPVSVYRGRVRAAVGRAPDPRHSECAADPCLLDPHRGRRAHTRTSRQRSRRPRAPQPGHTQPQATAGFWTLASAWPAYTEVGEPAAATEVRGPCGDCLPMRVPLRKIHEAITLQCLDEPSHAPQSRCVIGDTDWCNRRGSG
jgi:hypothetical protein